MLVPGRVSNWPTWRQGHGQFPIIASFARSVPRSTPEPPKPPSEVWCCWMVKGGDGDPGRNIGMPYISLDMILDNIRYIVRYTPSIWIHITDVYLWLVPNYHLWVEVPANDCWKHQFCWTMDRKSFTGVPWFYNSSTYMICEPAFIHLQWEAHAVAIL